LVFVVVFNILQISFEHFENLVSKKCRVDVAGGVKSILIITTFGAVIWLATVWRFQRCEERRGAEALGISRPWWALGSLPPYETCQNRAHSRIRWAINSHFPISVAFPGVLHVAQRFAERVRIDAYSQSHFFSGYVFGDHDASFASCI
jgi:hypothetical protein